MKQAAFCHLHTHSHFSLLDGLCKIDQLIDKAKEFKMPALALTDHGVMYGSIEFYKKARQAGIKPIIGLEIYISPRGMEDKQAKIDSSSHHLVLLAKNQTGYHNLIKLTTAAHLKGYYYKPRVDKEFLSRHSDGLIALTACLKGEVPSALLSNNLEQAEKIGRRYQEIFGKENFYLELQHHPNLPEQKIANERMIKLAKKINAPLVATNDVHYLNKDDAQAQEVLLCVQTGKMFDDKNRMTMAGEDFSFKSPKKMIEDFADTKEAVENTQKIADRCNLELELGHFIFPKLSLPGKITPEKKIEEICYQNLPKKYPGASAEIKNRLKTELSVIEKTSFANYMLVVSDYTNFAKKQGISTNTRGSAAGSIVSYLLGITNIDPIKYGLLFERFLNPERISWPDVDLDIADLRRDELIAYVSKKYGKERVAQIITFGTIAARNGVRDTGRVLGMPYVKVDEIAKLIPLGASLDEALKNVYGLRQRYDSEPEIKRLFDLAKKLEGVARHASVHAAGVVIADRQLLDYVPLQISPRGEKTIITQYEMHSLEDVGLIKMDFLGLANLTIIENALKIIRKTKEVDLNIEKIPLDDKETYKLLSAAKTSGVFQLECLSGETIVSNTTIKKLYKKRHKKRLQSVYLDEGKIHKNQIINVLKGEEKDLYALVAENNWHIKASKDHYFLTKNGWKKMEDIQIGEEVLIKERAKHLIFNTCKVCQKQINGQKEGKSNLCYQCSASFYKNPRKKISREKIKEAMIRFYQQGRKPWNYGLTSETNDILKKTSQKISLALTGRSLEDLWGKEKAEEFKKAHSERNRGYDNPMFGKTPPHRKGGFRSDLGHYVRSSWEADFARILQFHQIDYQYEPKTFRLTKDNGEILNYTPDFYVPSENTFYEIKGWLHNLDAEKIKLFQKQYPQTNFVIINSTKFAEFALKYKTLIKWECPKIPVKPSFKFIKVKEIKYSGREQTYDIVMKSPGNNFIANGFLVHNSEGMKKYLKELRPTDINDVMAMVSLYRPGPIELIPEYIAGKHGRRKITYLHPKLKPILAETYGVAVYQEQVLKIAQEICGFSLGQADILRKAIGKKIKKLLLEQKEKWIQGAIKNGVSKNIAAKLFEFVEPFARYGFNKAHAASYAMIAYQTAYLKTHFPAEFMAAWLTSEEGRDIDKVAFALNEAKSMGLSVLPPDINESFVDFGVIKDTGQISYSLASIKNVGRGAAEKIIEERKKNGKFKSFDDFLLRCDSFILNKKVIESLARAGALDQLAERNQILAGMEVILKFIQNQNKQRVSNQLGLFGKQDGASKFSIIDSFPKVPEAEKNQRLIWEKELLGMYISEHPLSEFSDILNDESITKVETLSVLNKNEVVSIAGINLKVQKIMTKNGAEMAFALLEDLSGQIEVVIFPKTFDQYSFLLQKDAPIVVAGKISDKDGVPKILADKIQNIAEIKKIRETISKEQAPKLYLTLSKTHNKETLLEIKKMIEECPGETEIILRLPKNGQYKAIKANKKVTVTEELLARLGEILGNKNIDVK